MAPLLPESTGFALLLWQVRTRPVRQLTCRLGECNEGFVLVVRDETTGDVPLHEVYANMVPLLKRAQSIRERYINEGWLEHSVLHPALA